MKTKLSLILLCILVAAGVPKLSSAQEGFLQKNVGFKAGLNYSHMNFHRGFHLPDETPLDSKPMQGLNIGVLLSFPVTKTLSIQPEYVYANRRGYLPDEAKNLNLHYLSLPVLLNVKATKNLSFIAGPQVDLLISGTEEQQGKSTNVTHDTEERNLGFVGGVRYAVFKHLFIDARYMHGISNVGLGQRSDVREFKYQIMELSLGFKF